MALEHILLGLLNEPSSGYDLKRRFEGAVRYFWPAELTQVYATLRRLEKAGLLKSRREASSRGPERRVYTVTPSGRAAFLRWLTDEPEIGSERFGYVAQVYLYAATGDFRRTESFLVALREFFARRLEAYERIESEAKGAAGPPLIEAPIEPFHQYLALRAGIHAMRSRQAWCDEALEWVRQRLSVESGPPAAPRRSRTTVRSNQGKGTRK